MKERIILLIRAKNFTAAQFADEIGVQKSGISHIISGRNNPSLDFVQKILLRFPEVNMDWLIMGKGPMFSGEPLKQTPPAISLFTIQEGDIRTPDLFSPEISPAFERKAEINPEVIVEENPTRIVEGYAKETGLENKLEIGKGPSVEKEVEEEEEKIPVKDHEPTTGINKKIEKVLFFYSDKTFLEYFPGN